LGDRGEAPAEIFFMTKPTADLPVVVQKAYELNLWLIQKVENFPRSYRFSVGDRLVQGVLDLLLRLVDAAYSRDKANILTEVNGMLKRCRRGRPAVCPSHETRRRTMGNGGAVSGRSSCRMHHSYSTVMPAVRTKT
jgi:hypothetical protein